MRARPWPFLFFILLPLTLPARDLESAAVRVAYTPYPPFVIEGSNPSQPRGVFIDYWEKQIAHKAKLKLEWVGPISLARAKMMVLNGDAGALASIPMDSAEKEKFVYSPKVKFFTHQAIIVRANEDLKEIKTPTDLKGKTIAKLRAGFDSPFLRDSGAKIDEIGLADDPMAHAFQMLLFKRVWGVYLVSGEAGAYIAARMGKLDEIKVLELPEDPPTFSATIGLSPKMKPELQKAILTAAEINDPGLFNLTKSLNRYLQDAAQESQTKNNQNKK